MQSLLVVLPRGPAPANGLGNILPAGNGRKLFVGFLEQRGIPLCASAQQGPLPQPPPIGRNVETERVLRSAQHLLGGGPCDPSLTPTLSAARPAPAPDELFINPCGCIFMPVKPTLKNRQGSEVVQGGFVSESWDNVILISCVQPGTRGQGGERTQALRPSSKPAHPAALGAFNGRAAGRSRLCVPRCHEDANGERSTQKSGPRSFESRWHPPGRGRARRCAARASRRSWQ